MNNTSDHTINDSVTPQSFIPPSAAKNEHRRRMRPWQWVGAMLLSITAIAIWFVFSAKSVVISSAHPSAIISTNGLWHLTLADHRLMLPGNYQIDATLADHFTISRDIAVTDEQNQVFELKFKPLPGHIKLNVSPQVKYYVLVDEMPTNAKHNVLSDVVAGTRVLQITAPNYFPVTTSVDVIGKRQTQQLDITLQPAWAQVTLTSSPSGASVMFDDKDIGTTPLTHQFIEGKHQLKFSKTGFINTQRSIDVIAQQALNAPLVALVQQPTQFTIAGVPSGVHVSLGDNYLGKTPLNINVSPGLNQPLLLVKDGYKSSRQQVNLMAGHPFETQYKLSPLTTNVTFEVMPKHATIHINDVNKGQANQTLTLPTTRQVVTIKATGYVDHTRIILPSQSQQQLISVTLKTPRQSQFEQLKPQIVSHTGSPLKLFKPNAIFTMGASRREQGRRANETSRKIKLDRPFYLGLKEITNQEFKQFKLKHSSGHIKGNSLNGQRQPVVSLSWIDAVSFCNWLSDKEGLTAAYDINNGQVVKFNSQANGYRLPSEAEWAWAARYDRNQMKKYQWGKTLPPRQGAGNFADVTGAPILGEILTNYNDKFIATAPVASFAPNQLGLFDIDGNVAEWVHDYYHIKTTLGNRAEHNPSGPTKGNHHVIRGSSWAHGTRTQLRLSYRDYGVDGRNDVGFRIARNAQ